MKKRVILCKSKRLLPSGLADFCRGRDTHESEDFRKLWVRRKCRFLDAEFLSRPSRFSPSSDSALISISRSSSRHGVGVHAQRHVDEAQLFGRVAGDHAQENTAHTTMCRGSSSRQALASTSRRQLVQDVLGWRQPVTLGGQTKALGQLLQTVAHLHTVQRTAHGQRVEDERGLARCSRQHMMDTSNSAFCATTAVRLQSMLAKNSGKSLCGHPYCGCQRCPDTSMTAPML